MRYIFLFISFLSFSQDQTARGVILDKETRAPIPYVNIAILESTFGTSSDESGSYLLEIKKLDLSKYVKLSSLGYRDTTLTIQNFIKLKEVLLTPIAEQLSEVVISEKFEEKTMVVNPINEEDLSSGFGTNAKNPWIIALYMPYDSIYDDINYLKSVRFHFGNYKNKRSKFRLRMFSIGKDSLPDKDILKSNVIIDLKKKQKFADIDISDQNLVFPTGGIYIAFEWLYIPYNEEKVTYVFEDKKNVKGVQYLPKFSAIEANEGDYTIAAYISGLWRFYSPNKFRSDKKLVPAISLTLSN